MRPARQARSLQAAVRWAGAVRGARASGGHGRRWGPGRRRRPPAPARPRRARRRGWPPGQRRCADRAGLGRPTTRVGRPAPCRATSPGCAGCSTRGPPLVSTTPGTGWTCRLTRSTSSASRSWPPRGTSSWRRERPPRPARRWSTPWRSGGALRSSSSWTRAWAIAQAATLEERRLTVLEERVDADLALGRQRHVVGELQQLAAEHPLREGCTPGSPSPCTDPGARPKRCACSPLPGPLREELGLEPRPRAARPRGRHPGHDPSLDPPAMPRPGRGAGGGRRPCRSSAGTRAGALLAAHAEAPADARFVVLEGDPGIGKTRLAERARGPASAGSLAVWARRNEIGAAQALWPWLGACARCSARSPTCSAVLASGDPAAPWPGRRRAARTVRRHRRHPRAGWADGTPGGGPRRPAVVRSRVARPAAVPRRPVAARRVSS